MSTRYDLSTSTYVWEPGPHSLTFVSQASGYRDADPSSALTFTVYEVNLTATHGTLSDAVTKIAPWETKTVTLTADTGYSVPASIDNPPTGVTYTKTSSSTATIVIDGSLVEDAVTLPLVCVNKLATPTGVEATGTVVSFNPVENAESYDIYADGSQIGTFTPTPPTPTMPSKGDLIEIENKRYRVLDVNGTTAKVFGLFDAVRTWFGSYNTYAGSRLDTFLNNTWFNGSSNSDTFRAAVVPTNIISHTYLSSYSEPASWIYKYDFGWTPNDTYYVTRKASAPAITRNVFALDVEDYFTYHESNTTTSNDLMMFFFEGDGSQGSYSNNVCLLRSARSDDSKEAWCVSSDFGSFGRNNINSEFAVRPAFQIDLSKIPWTPSN